MKRALGKRIAVGLLLVAAAVLGGIAACSNQGEGERCEITNGDDDCKTGEGLICTRASDLSNSNSDRCCPSDRSRATAPVCLTPINIVGGDGSAPPDTGPPADAETDAGDAGTEDADAGSTDAGEDADGGS